ncbi:helix-turn-helix domain-containing protein [Hominicoprocola fusiformis]
MRRLDDLITSLDSLPVVLRVDEVKAILRIGRNQCYELIRSGQLRSLRIGRQLRIPRDAVEQYLSRTG